MTVPSPGTRTTACTTRRWAPTSSFSTAEGVSHSIAPIGRYSAAEEAPSVRATRAAISHTIPVLGTRAHRCRIVRVRTASLLNLDDVVAKRARGGPSLSSTSPSRRWRGRGPSHGESVVRVVVREQALATEVRTRWTPTRRRSQRRLVADSGRDTRNFAHDRSVRALGGRCASARHGLRRRARQMTRSTSRPRRNTGPLRTAR
jgi:hypothetical protein